MKPNYLILYNEFIASLRNLAAPAERQIEYLDKHEVGPLLDELALEFDAGCVIVDIFVSEKLLNTEAVPYIRLLDSKLDKMSDNKGLWLFDILATSQEWEEVRQLARTALEQINA